MTDLVPIDEGIWLCDGDIVDFYGFPYPTRMVVIRLASGLLWVWSPIALSANLMTEVDALGRVGHLVSPNKIHHLYLQDWKAAYPAAKLWGPASTVNKRTDLAFQSALNDTAPPDWAGEIDQFWFTGSFFLDEVVFLHRASRTAILADLSENFSAEFLNAHWKPWARVIARIWKIVQPYGYPPLEWRASWISRARARDTLARLLDADPDKVVMAHGEWQREGGRAYLEKAFGWLT
ncbi:MAG: DUF4336 domain-containing protein [Pseudomonadales bacterium]